MAWDIDAQTMAVNVIAHVEGAGAWDAINYNDPITIGLMQWFGTRAAALLEKIRTDNPSSWDNTVNGIDSLDAALNTYGPSSSYWVSRYLTGTEGRALKPVLRANHTAQSETVADDIEDYRVSATRVGMNPDTNTDAVIFFCVMYHQTPARAIRIINSAGPNSSIDRIYAVCMNDPVFGRYRTRYTTALNTIKSGVPPTIIDLDDDDRPISDGDNGGGSSGEGSTDSGLTQLKGILSYLTIVGDNIHVRTQDGETIIAYPTVSGRYVVAAKAGSEGVPVPDETPDPGPPPTGTAETLRQALVDHCVSRLGTLGYTNDYRRTDPDGTGYTDCSGLMKQAHADELGITLGQITSQQYTQGYLVDSGSGNTVNESILRPGDLIYIKWNRAAWQSPKVTDHVEMWTGPDSLVGHPGPGAGPRMSSITNLGPFFQSWWIRRHVMDDGRIV